MEVVLNKDVQKLGYKGEVVRVREGYFRNFLWPRSLAEVATEERKTLAALRREKMVISRKQLLENTRKVLDKLKGLTVTIKAKVSGKGKLYAGIGEDAVIAAVEKAAKIQLEKEYLKMEHIKEVGEHKVLIQLGPDMEQKITVVVEKA